MTASTVKYALSHSKASAGFCCDLSEHFGFAGWSNENDRVKYQNLGHHTLSLYTQGGNTTRRLDKRSAGTGAPGKFCILPAGSDSDWEVGERQNFVHIYFSDSSVKQLALEEYDIDPRRVELPELTFFQDPKLLAQYHTLLSKSFFSPEERLVLQEGMWLILGDLLKGYSVKPVSNKMYRGGITKKALTEITDYIYSNLHRQIYIEELASVAKMSPFHFIRMYKVSTGMTPLKKVLSIRMERSVELLTSNYTQVEISVCCGFSSQSHFSRAFHKYYGVTPRQYKNIKN